MFYLIALILGSFTVWTPFNIVGFTPVSFYLVIFLLATKYTSVLRSLTRKKYLILPGLFLVSDLFITPIVFISKGVNINFNHIFAEIYIFCLLLPVCIYIVKFIEVKIQTEIYFKIFLFFSATIFVEYGFGVAGINLNNLLGFPQMHQLAHF